MRILIIRNYPSFMDVKYNTYNVQEIGLARALVKKGHSCDLIFWTNNKEFDLSVDVENGRKISIFYRNSKVILKNAIYPHLEDLITKYDVVQLAEYNQLQTWQLAQKHPDKVVVYHGPYYSPYNKQYNLMCSLFDMFCLKRYLKLNTKFLVKSNLAKENLLKKGIKEANISVTGVGIDLDAFSSNNSNPVPDFIHGIDFFKSKIRLLYVGRLEPRRNILFLYDVVKEIHDVGVPVELIEIGTGNPEYVELCNNYAKKIGIHSFLYHISVMEQKYLPEVYRRCSFFLLPTNYEIFGMVLLEAMYYGLVTLTTHNGGSEMLIKNNQNGFILRLDKKEWAQIIINHANNHSEYTAISQNATESIKAKYTWDIVAERMLNGYRALGDVV